MTTRKIVLQNTDLVFYLTDFLDDISSFNLFNSNKYYNTIIKTHQHRYTIKKRLDTQYDKHIILSSNYKIKMIELYYNVDASMIEKLPNSLNYLHITIPLKITDINIADYLHGIIKSPDKNIDKLPDNLSHLKISGDFNYSIYNLPSKLNYLEISGNFNQPIDNLPKNLKNLKLGHSFNQTLDNLPPSLEKLSLFYTSFNKPVNYLPLSLKTISFGFNFDQPVDNLPSSLEKLSFYYKFDHPVDNLPKGLKTLIFSGGKFNQTLDNLPKGLKTLMLQKYYVKGTRFNQPIDNLPPTLEKLVISDHFNHPIDKLPLTLKEVTIYSRSKQLDLSYLENAVIKMISNNLEI